MTRWLWWLFLYRKIRESKRIAQECLPVGWSVSADVLTHPWIGFTATNKNLAITIRTATLDFPWNVGRLLRSRIQVFDNCAHEWMLILDEDGTETRVCLKCEKRESMTKEKPSLPSAEEITADVMQISVSAVNLRFAIADAIKADRLRVARLVLESAAKRADAYAETTCGQIDLAYTTAKALAKHFRSLDVEKMLLEGK
jgi:hypothetical protein